MLLRVRVREAGGDLPVERERVRRRDRALVDQRAQRRARDEVHDEVRLVLPHAEVDDRHAVRVRELAHHPRLALEPRLELAVARERRVQELDRDDLADGNSLGLVDRAHRSGGHHLEDLVATLDECADPLLRVSLVRPLLFAPVFAVVVLVGHHEVISHLARLLVLDDTLEQPLAVGLAGLHLHVRDLGREHEQLAHEILCARELDDMRVIVLVEQRPVKVIVIEQDDLGRTRADDAVRVAASHFQNFSNVSVVATAASLLPVEPMVGAYS